MNQRRVTIQVLQGFSYIKLNTEPVLTMYTATADSSNLEANVWEVALLRTLEMNCDKQETTNITNIMA